MFHYNKMPPVPCCRLLVIYYPVSFLTRVQRLGYWHRFSHHKLFLAVSALSEYKVSLSLLDSLGCDWIQLLQTDVLHPPPLVAHTIRTTVSSLLPTVAPYVIVTKTLLPSPGLHIPLPRRHRKKRLLS